MMEAATAKNKPAEDLSIVESLHQQVLGKGYPATNTLLTHAVAMLGSLLNLN